MRRYVQAPGPIGEYSRMSLAQRAGPLDLVYVAYGLLVVAVVVASYLLGAFGWLPHDPQAMNVGLINAAPFTPGHLLGTDFLGRACRSRPRKSVPRRCPGVNGAALISPTFIACGSCGSQPNAPSRYEATTTATTSRPYAT